MKTRRVHDFLRKGLCLIQIVRRSWVGHLAAILVSAQDFLRSLRRPFDKIVEAVASNHGHVIIGFVQSFRIHRAQRVRTTGSRPSAFPSAVLLNNTPFGIQLPRHIAH